jgi:septum formation protein
MDKKIILASGSPRRKELLGMAGVSFEVRVFDIDETPRKKEHPKTMVRRLSVEKAMATVRTLEGKESFIVIAADTTVVNPAEKNLGKPGDEAEAVRMVYSLQGKTHSVYTGYSVLLVQNGKVVRKVTRAVRTRVKIQAMSRNQVKAYVAKGECMDKAGAYAAQGFGMAIIEKISGSYTNVVGLPMTEVMRDLVNLGWRA